MNDDEEFSLCSTLVGSAIEMHFAHYGAAATTSLLQTLLNDHPLPLRVDAVQGTTVVAPASRWADISDEDSE